MTLNKKSVRISPGGRKQDQEAPGLHDSRNLKVSVNLNKRKKQRKR